MGVRLKEIALLCLLYLYFDTKTEQIETQMQKWQEVLEFILTKNEFKEMEDDKSGLIVTDHPSKENVTVISQEVDEKKPLVIHMDTSNEVPTFEFDPNSFFQF